jgi:hypothetical protein
VTAAKGARIDAHLADCVQCSRIDAALTSLPSVLAATDLPPIPDALTLQIQTAIARESAGRVGTGPASTAPAPTETGAVGGTAGVGARGAGIPGRPDLPERRRGRPRRFRRPDWSSPLLLRGLAAAAVVVVIAGAGILLANAHTASPTSSAVTGSGGGAPARPGEAGGNGRNASLGARASAPAMVSYRLNGRIATTAVIASQTNFTHSSMPRLVRTRVASVTGIAVGGAASNLRRAASPTSQIGGVRISELQSCLSVMSRGRKVLLVDVARFLGRPAMIVVLKSLTGADLLDVGIVGPGCSASNLDIIRMLTIPVR